MTRRFGAVVRVAVLASLVTALAAPAVDARPGGGKSSGSRGSQTYSAPPATATAPKAAQPMQRTETPTTAARPGGVGAGAATAAAPSRGLGFGGGLMAGLLGAGLLGMLFGGGLFGGLGGLASMLGLLLQVALIGGLIWLAIRFFRRRSEPAMAGAGANGPMARSALGGALAGGAAGSALGGSGPSGPALQPVQIGPEDYQAFERILGEVQTAYGRQDVEALTHVMTSEMTRYMSSDLEEDRSKGLRNEVSEPKLLQGDLAEAWREGGTEYATVAMRFSVVDATVDVATGRVVGGDRTRPVEATELWTFRRDMRGPWLVSAIQQTA